MIHAKRHFVKCLHARSAIGGFFCYCCAPRDRTGRKKEIRAVRRTMKQEVAKLDTKDE